MSKFTLMSNPRDNGVLPNQRNPLVHSCPNYGYRMEHDNSVIVMRASVKFTKSSNNPWITLSEVLPLNYCTLEFKIILI